MTTASSADLERGLDADEAARRLERSGPNELTEAPGDGIVRRLVRQLRDPMGILLMVAAAISGLALGERIDATAILAIVLLNTVIALVQEGRASRALDALRRLETPTATVRRGGVTMSVRAREVVPGDVVVLAAGDRVAADVRLEQTTALEVDESLLTGESLPVSKHEAAERVDAAGVADRPWMAFAGTMITRGQGVGVTENTGMGTALGAIAEKLEAPRVATPLQRDLKRLTVRLGVLTAVIGVGVAGLVIVRMGTDADALQQAFLVGVALAVAAVPEGLATVTTLSLALGVRRMAERGAIIRRLPAVETLGATTVLAIDKTGTLTENRMVVAFVVLADGSRVVPGELSGSSADSFEQVAALCNDATTQPATGDPLEVALLEAVGAERVHELRDGWPRIDAVPFSSERRLMTTVHRTDGGALVLVKGAPETVVERSVRALSPAGEDVPLDRETVFGAAEDAAGEGMRLIGLAKRRLDELPADASEVERDLTFVGFAALRDPVRTEAAPSVREAQAAGVRVVMVTGDHAGTAATVGREVGLAGDRLVTGRALDEDGIPSSPSAVSVYARVDPDQKLALVEAFRDQGEVVAVTGDGVNDAPALRRADIGVALGRSGTDVAREAADMVITDDNLATIVAAIREGRGIYMNLRKVVDYLLTCNLSEVTVVIVVLLAFPAIGMPLLPLQLLWMNLVTDGLPALALGVDPPHPHVMRRAPRRRDVSLLGGRRIGVLFTRGLVLAAATIASLVIVRYAWGGSWYEARAVMFTVLVGAQLMYAFGVRAAGSGGRVLRGNPRLVGAVVGGFALQALIVSWPAAHDLFGTTRFDVRTWVLVGGLSAGAALILAVLGVREHASTETTVGHDSVPVTDGAVDRRP